MSDQIHVKYEEMKSYGDKLNALLSEIKGGQVKWQDVVGKGSVATEIESIGRAFNTVVDALSEFVMNSQKFVMDVAELFKESDKLILDPRDQKVTTSKRYYREVETQWDSKLNQTPGNIDSHYYKTNFSKGQCTWYCHGRFWETTGIRLNGGNAKEWVASNSNRPDVYIEKNLNNVEAPAVAVADMGNQYGHVVYVEQVIRDENGNVTDIYITEANWDLSNNYEAGVDGIVKKYSVDQFKRKMRGLSGFIMPKK